MEVFVVLGYKTRNEFFGSIDDVIEIEEPYVDSIFTSKGQADAHALSIDGFVETHTVK